MSIKTRIFPTSESVKRSSEQFTHSQDMSEAYAPSAESMKRGGHTVISGVDSIKRNVADEQGLRAVRESIVKLQSRPLFGILYSVSCDAFGEIYPLYVGRNIIGSVPEADVYLAEESVEHSHAIILIRNFRDEDGTMTTTSIVDNDTWSGTRLNGSELGCEKAYLRNGDRICVGNCYEFIFIALDPENMKISLREDFRPIKRVVYNPYTPVVHVNESHFIDDGIVYPSVVGAEDEATFYGRSKKKEEDHSVNKTVQYVAGKTVVNQEIPGSIRKSIDE